MSTRRRDLSAVDVTREFPRPFGQAAALEAMGTIAAPLLAGFAFASIGVILQVQKSLRWPDQALVLVVAATLLFITSLQASFNARRHWVPPDQWSAWLGLAPSPARRGQLQREWTSDLASYRRWSEAARITYNLAIVVLLAAIAVLLVPRGDIELWRTIGIVLACAGALGEVAWVLAASRARRPTRKVVRYSRTEVVPAAVASPRLRPSSRASDEEPTESPEPDLGDQSR